MSGNEKDCSSFYRLGDMVKYNGTDMYGITQQYAECHSETIGGKYAKATSKREDYKLLTSLAQQFCPPPRSGETVIHIRLGDVLCNKNDTKYPISAELTAEVLNSILPSSTPKTLIYASPNSNDDCVSESEKYIQTVRSNVDHAEIHTSANPDDDFCRMVNAEVFVAGRGGFSGMAAEVRKVLGRETIQHPKLSGYVLGDQWYQKDPVHANYMKIKRT
tara:strand:- start:61 stop:714 length:654 start_codon:yes stop_codon:yes gene_type:complete